MVTPSTRNVLVAFIASPSDVPEERLATREVIEELNKSLRTLNWQIDIIGWEDTAPGVGRPQELINKDVDTCDLFIGILWKRWGQPTGEYSSGFEEEFERAIERRNETGSPAVWLAFKHVDSELLKDPGEQLQHVLEFKQKQIELRRVLFQEFPNIERWKALLSTWLLNYIFKQVSELQQPTEPVSNAATSEPLIAGPADLPSPPEEINKKPSREQILEVLSSIKGAVEGTSLDKLSLGTSELDPFMVVRHHLLSTALISTQISSIMLGVHDTQRLYLYRDRLQTLPMEVILLLRMLINDTDGLIPGWYWFSWMDEKMLKVALFDFAYRDRNSNVRARAWEMLAAARILPMEDTATWDAYLKSMLRDEAPVKKAGMLYLGAVGSKRDLPTIKSKLDDSSISGEATIARLLVLARNNPAQVLTESIPKYLPEKKRIITELRKTASNINKDALLRALQNKETDEDVKFVAIEALKRKNELTDDIASSLLEVSSGRVAEVCYRHLIDKGEKFSPADVYLKVGDETYNQRHGSDYFFRDLPYADANAIILEIFKSYPEKDLWELVDWQADIDLRDVAYKALALHHFNKVSSRVRDDLNQEFKSYADPYLEAAIIKRIKQKEEEKSQHSSMRPMDLFAGAFESVWKRRRNEKEPTPEDSAKSETEGVKSKYIAAALAGIAQNGEEDDIIFGRRYLPRDDYDVRVESVNVIKKFGDEDDIQSLIEVTKTTEGVLQESAALAALELSPDVKETARSLLLTAKEDLARTVVSYLTDEQEVAAVSAFLELLLKEESDVVRRKAAAFFANKFTEEELKELLGRYMSQSPYYYDVVCWLDKILYAPAQLKGTFVSQLKDELSS
jgi:HEAT repeat protein